MKNTLAVVSLSAVFALVASANADFVTPDGTNVHWVRGVSINSAYGQWESFATVAGPNAPGVGPVVVGTLPGGAPAFNVAASGPTAVVLGSGNIYSGNAPLGMTVTLPSFDLGAVGTTTILLQTRTQGTEINPATVRINGIAPSQVTELSRVSLGQQGALVETAWRFDLPGNAAGYTVSLSSFGPFFSLDAVAVDVFIPSPGAATVLALGAMAACRRRR